MWPILYVHIVAFFCYSSPRGEKRRTSDLFLPQILNAVRTLSSLVLDMFSLIASAMIAGCYFSRRLKIRCLVEMTEAFFSLDQAIALFRSATSQTQLPKRNPLKRQVRVVLRNILVWAGNSCGVRRAAKTGIKFLLREILASAIPSDYNQVPVGVITYMWKLVLPLQP